MRTRYIMLGMAVIAMLVSYISLSHSQSSSIHGSNIADEINSTSSFIKMVNQSGYLIFYPNLNVAYGYLNLAKEQSQKNVSYSYMLLAMARDSAQSQLNMIGQYKTESLYVLIISAAILAVVLYFLMIPRKTGVKSGRRGK